MSRFLNFAFLILILFTCALSDLLPSSPIHQSITGFAKGFICGLGDGVLQTYERDEKDGFKRRAPQQIKNNAAKVCLALFAYMSLIWEQPSMATHFNVSSSGATTSSKRYGFTFCFQTMRQVVFLLCTTVRFIIRPQSALRPTHADSERCRGAFRGHADLHDRQQSGLLAAAGRVGVRIR